MLKGRRWWADAYDEAKAKAADIYRKFLRGDAVGALLAWQPCEPNGEKAWFLLADFDGGEGACAYFMRRAVQIFDGSEARSLPWICNIQ